MRLLQQIERAGIILLLELLERLIVSLFRELADRLIDQVGHAREGLSFCFFILLGLSTLGFGVIFFIGLARNRRHQPQTHKRDCAHESHLEVISRTLSPNWLNLNRTALPFFLSPIKNSAISSKSPPVRL